MRELLINADVCIVEISHEVDHRLQEFTKLEKKWFKGLVDYLKEDSLEESNYKTQIQVSFISSVYLSY